MKRITKISIALLVAIPLLVVVAMLSCLGEPGQPDQPEQHFSSPLPSTAKQIHYERHPMGIDIAYAFVFEVSDDQLLTQLIKEWALSPAISKENEPMSFVALHPPTWWHDPSALRAFPERYGWIDKSAERYRSVWVDRKNKKLFAEYGRW